VTAAQADDVGRAADPGDRPAAASVSLAEATRTWAKIGLLSFGGPAGQIALMHRILVDEKRWISETRFLHALNFCMLLPGPEAQQLATYMGWLLHRVRGGLIAGTLFILPGFVTILALSYLYVTVGEVAAVQGLFVGMKAAVIAIVLHALVRIGSRSLKSTASAAVSLAAFAAMFLWQVPFPIVIAAAALVGTLAARNRQPDEKDVSESGDDARRIIFPAIVLLSLWVAPTAFLIASLGGDNVFATIALFFSKMAVVTFGGAYAVLAYVSQEAVTVYHWLQPGQMLDGLAMAETTPGPLIMVTQFVGFMAAYRDAGPLPQGLAAFLGAALTTWVTFVPCFLWIFIGAPFMERLRQSALLSGALAGITAAVVGVIANLALWFSIHTLFATVTAVEFAGGTTMLPDPVSVRPLPVAIAVVALVMLFRYHASVVAVLAFAGAVGVVSAFL